METVQQAGEPRLRFESVLSELLARVDDDDLVGRVQDAWAAFGSPQAGEPTDALPEPITKAIAELREAEWRSGMNRADRGKIEYADHWAKVLDGAIRAALASRPQQPQADTPPTADLLRDLKMQYGMVGNVDVAAWNAKLDRAIAALSAQPQAETPLTDERIEAVMALVDTYTDHFSDVADGKLSIADVVALKGQKNAIRSAIRSLSTETPLTDERCCDLAKVADDLLGAIDLQTYDEFRRAEWELPDEHEFEVTVTAGQQRALSKAICAVQAAKRHPNTGALPPAEKPLTDEAMARCQLEEGVVGTTSLMEGETLEEAANPPEAVSREDFDKLSADLTRAKNLLVRLHSRFPDARSQIEGSTGTWFVWGTDRDAASPPEAEPVYCGCGDQIMKDDGAMCGNCVMMKRPEASTATRLTDKQIDKIFDSFEDAPTMAYRYLVARAIEAAFFRTTEAAPVLAQHIKESSHGQLSSDRRAGSEDALLQRDGTRANGEGATGVGQAAVRVAEEHRAEEGVTSGGAAKAPSSHPPEAEPTTTWRCFHCGDVFTEQDAAREHFGPSEYDKPYCQMDAGYIRWLLEQHRRNVDEDSEALRTVLSLANEHDTLRRRAEEQGYARGLADAKKHPEELGLYASAPADAKDAARYRWLRDPRTDALVYFLKQRPGPAMPEHPPMGSDLHSDNLDAAIDSALQSHQEAK